jgi:hypothetical protein
MSLAGDQDESHVRASSGLPVAGTWRASRAGPTGFPKPRRTRADVSRSDSMGRAQGRRRSWSRGRARRSWVCAVGTSHVHRSAAAGSRSCGAVQPRICSSRRKVCSMSKRRRKPASTGRHQHRWHRPGPPPARAASARRGWAGAACAPSSPDDAMSPPARVEMGSANTRICRCECVPRVGDDTLCCGDACSFDQPGPIGWSSGRYSGCGPGMGRHRAGP